MRDQNIVLMVEKRCIEIFAKIKTLITIEALIEVKIEIKTNKIILQSINKLKNPVIQHNPTSKILPLILS